MKSASSGPACSNSRASSIIPNSIVADELSIGIRPVSTSSIRKNAAIANRCAGRTTSASEWLRTAFMAYGRSVPVMKATEKNTKISVGSTRIPTIVARLAPIEVYCEPPSSAASAVTNPASANMNAPPRMSP